MKRLALALIPAALLAGCGARRPVERRIPSRTLRIYLSGPFVGASSSGSVGAIRGAQMALAAHGARLGRYRLVLRLENDATAQSGGWDPSQTTLDARRAALDPDTVGYIGDFDSGASAISIPILNRSGIPQVSPEGGAVGLTSGEPGASPGEPAKYYPTGRRNFVRVVPTFAVESAVAVALQSEMGCRSRYVLEDGPVDGEDAGISFVLAAQAVGIHVLGVQSYERDATSYAELAAAVAHLAPDCILLAATDERSAARVTDAVLRALPSVRIFATSPLADPAYANPLRGGIALWADPRVLVLSPGLGPGAYPPAGRAFLARYARLYGAAPPQAIFGYEAMRLLLRAVATATDAGRAPASRSSVIKALLQTRRRKSALGPYRIDPNGDISIRTYGIWRVRDGALAFWRAEHG